MSTEKDKLQAEVFQKSDASIYDSDAWLVRPCEWYKDEHSECTKIRSRFHQLFIFGKTLDCEHWKQDYATCMNFRKNDDVDSLNKLILHEQQRRQARNTFNLELNEDNEPEVHVHILSEDRRELFAADQNQLWSIVARSLMNSKIFDVNSKFLAILSFTRYTFQSTVDPDQMTHQEMTNSIKGLASLGGGGLALVSSQCLYTWPESVHEIMDCFTNCDIVDRTKFMDDSCNRRTRGGCFATTLGSCVHELGHTFDLGHSNIGFMSTGFNRIDELFTNVHSCRKVKWWNTSSALILTQHKWLNASYEDRKVTYPIILMDNDIVKSNFGMTVIEYRERANSNIISYDSFTLPKKIVKLRCFNVNVIIMDVLGNILRLD
ncbi:UPF0545 protein C22orf39 -like protein [Halotydeus destructor]|nr:UPF0545 protein C22orf39 -like protein [Halotydeus destructor]